MTGRISQAMITTMFKEFIIPHSRANAAMLMMQELREQKGNKRWDTEARAAYLLAPSQSGKSHTVGYNYFDTFIVPEFRAKANVDPAVSDADVKLLQKLVLYVKVPARPHLGAFAAAILEALGDPHPWKDAPYERLARALTQLEEAGVELLIFDNFDHLTKAHTRDLQGEASRIQDILKEMIEKGWPMVFVGLPSAKKSILSEIQIGHRMDEIYFGPFATAEKEFVEYLSSLDILMLDSGIFDEGFPFEDPRVFNRLLVACAGQLGIASNTIRCAAKLASAEKKPKLSINHLSTAVRTYNLRLKVCDYNPFDINDKQLARGLRSHAIRIREWEEKLAEVG